MLPLLYLFFLFTIYVSCSIQHISTKKLSNVLVAQSISLIENVEHISHGTKNNLESNSSLFTNKTDKHRMKFIKASKHHQMTNLEPANILSNVNKKADKHDKPQMSFIKTNKHHMMPDDKADKLQISFIKVNKAQMTPDDKVDKPQMSFIKTDKHQMVPDVKADKPQMSFIKANKHQMVPDVKANKPQMSFIKTNKPQILSDDKSDEVDNDIDKDKVNFNPEHITWTPEHILLGTYIEQLDRVTMQAASVPHGHDAYENSTRILGQKKLGIFRNFHTKPYIIILSSVIFTFFIMTGPDIFNYTIFKYKHSISWRLGECFLVSGWNNSEETEARKIWDNDELLEKHSQKKCCRGAALQKRCKRFLWGPPTDSVSLCNRSNWILINIIFSMVTIIRIMVNVDFKKLSAWQIYELIGLIFFNNSIFIKVIAQILPVLNNVILYNLPSGEPEDKWTKQKRQEERQKRQEEGKNPQLEKSQLEEPYDRQNFCEKRHKVRDSIDDKRLIVCCYNVREQREGEEKCWYMYFAYPLSTKFLLVYDETFTTTGDTIVSMITLFIFVIMCVPYAITHVIPMIIIYGWLSIGLVLMISFFTYITITLPLLKKRKCLRMRCYWTHFRKIIGYVIFIYLYNFLFNWGILFYTGHGYVETMHIDFFSPSRKLDLYMERVHNSSITKIEFINMLL